MSEYPICTCDYYADHALSCPTRIEIDHLRARVAELEQNEVRFRSLAEAMFVTGVISGRVLAMFSPVKKGDWSAREREVIDELVAELEQDEILMLRARVAELEDDRAQLKDGYTAARNGELNAKIAMKKAEQKSEAMRAVVEAAVEWVRDRRNADVIDSLERRTIEYLAVDGNEEQVQLTGMEQKAAELCASLKELMEYIGHLEERRPEQIERIGDSDTNKMLRRARLLLDRIEKEYGDE